MTGKRTNKRGAGKTLAAGLREDATLDATYRALFSPLCASIAKAFGQGPPEPEEVVQAAFTKFLTVKDRHAIREPRAWLFMVARNIILDHKRHKKHVDAYVAEQLAYDPDYEIEEITPLRVVENRERFDVLIATMKRLPHKQQVMLTMNRVHGKTYQEISKETGWSLGHISAQINEAKQALLEALEAADRPKPKTTED